MHHRSVAQTAPKSPFLCGNKSLIRYDFRASAKTSPYSVEQSLKVGKLRSDSVAAYAYSSHHGSLEFLIVLSVRAVETVGQVSVAAFWYASNDYILS